MRKIIIALGVAAFASAAIAQCMTQTVFGPNGGVAICTTCCTDGSCTTTCM